ncbi:MAG TPA: DNA polymerase IV [Caldisericia bacterium]|nr:DNA polymerase IV [Caldisericia bacterium]
MKEKFQRYLHVDADMFFAAIEIQRHPEWKGKAVIIGHPSQARSVVSTASYEARSYGVHSGMPVKTALKLCPNGVFVLPDHTLYSQISRKMFIIFEKFIPDIQAMSVDEAYANINSLSLLYDSEEVLAIRLKEEIRSSLGITVSVGIASTRLLAKISAGKHKPDGLTIVVPGNEKAFLSEIPVAEVPGIGKKTQTLLHSKNIVLMRDIYHYSLKELLVQFGSTGLYLWNTYHAIEEEVMVCKNPSMSREYTFDENTSDPEKIKKVLLKLSKDIGFSLRTKQVTAFTVGIKLRFPPFRTITRQSTHSTPLQSDLDLYHAVCTLYQPYFWQSLRLIGIFVSNFTQDRALYDEHEDKKELLDSAMDTVRNKFGKSKLKRLLELS